MLLLWMRTVIIIFDSIILKYFEKNNISMMLNKCLIQWFWVDNTTKAHIVFMFKVILGMLISLIMPIVLCSLVLTMFFRINCLTMDLATCLKNVVSEWVESSRWRFKSYSKLFWDYIHSKNWVNMSIYFLIRIAYWWLIKIDLN